jgi:hypothetical protein
MTSRVEYCLEKAVECDRTAQRALDKEIEALYLAKYWNGKSPQSHRKSEASYIVAYINVVR